MSATRLRLAVLFPELLGTYGDGGNVIVLEQRLRWRGLDAELVPVSLGQAIPSQCDLYVVGGGEDHAQQQALDALRRSPGLQQAAERLVPIFAVCAGMQILGTAVTDRAGKKHDGLGLIDLETRLRTWRAVGEVVAEPADDLGLPALMGFANHAGGTRLGPGARPLATVQSGVGNGDPDLEPGHAEVEGALQGSVVATYLHGPVLARNPALADLLLSRALGSPLTPWPDDPSIDDVRREMVERCNRRRSRRRSPRELLRGRP